jgi:ERCC4-related helicase
MTARQITNQPLDNLYSLNSARIDFVPYQFRPAMKLIKSEVPRMLIADSVGVGKTIEAGLIMKEMQARQQIEKILIVCPKPLVAERKWELEMKRFDEEFTSVDGPKLRAILKETDYDGEWPARDGKSIIPFSLLEQAETLYGRENGRSRPGLLNLDPAPHFDMLIVDEAHHIRNTQTNAYKAVKFLCDNADIVVFLTATPLQTSDKDLFTLLNALRPDLIINYNTFSVMAQPNANITKAARLVRSGAGNWTKDALRELESAAETEWGRRTITGNPVYQNAIRTLKSGDISRDQRVQLISDVENLHSFAGLINRTRRQDIEDFCVRRTHTIESEFTPIQKELHDELLSFEASVLSALHGNLNVRFMMSTVMRQAASCIFGLAPFMEHFVARRLNELLDDPEFDPDDYALDENDFETIQMMAGNLIKLSGNLPNEDPKLDGLLEILAEKRDKDNNKVIIFSTFKHTLAYLRKKLEKTDFRVTQIDGNVKDEERYELRKRFALPQNDPKAVDILLFTEVGSEGLDYQFCDTMINYDLPWNPMRVEQRIGRIDRRGQQSETVGIYNMITAGTLDAEIYRRCLRRVGVFEESIGECSEILGEITKRIQDIVFDAQLTEAERLDKLEQMTDNEVRHIQEMRSLEEAEKQLFGIDLSEQMMTKDVQDAENPWIAPRSVQSMIEKYLSSRIGEGTYISGEGAKKSLRLSGEARGNLLDDCRKLSASRSSVYRNWERYLKSGDQFCALTFDAFGAEQNRDAPFITASHPLARQAAAYFDVPEAVCVGAAVSASEIDAGEYPFLIYAWDYLGFKRQRKLVAICEDKLAERALMGLLRNAAARIIGASKYTKKWERLELDHWNILEPAIKTHRMDAQASFKYKSESLEYSFGVRRQTLENQIMTAEDDKIRRMRDSELKNAEARYSSAIEKIRSEAEKADIGASLLVNGVLFVEG